jgi:uncharacterized membrane protein
VASLISNCLVAVFFLALAVFVIWMTSAAKSGRLKRNQYMGIRTPATMRSDEAWVTGHSAGLGALYAGAILMLGADIVVVVLWLNSRNQTLSDALPFINLAALLVSVVWAGVAAHRAARAVDDEPQGGGE